MIGGLLLSLTSCAKYGTATNPADGVEIPDILLQVDEMPQMETITNNGDLWMHIGKMNQWGCNLLTDMAELVEYLTDGRQTIEECTED